MPYEKKSELHYGDICSQIKSSLVSFLARVRFHLDKGYILIFADDTLRHNLLLIICLSTLLINLNFNPSLFSLKRKKVLYSIKTSHYVKKV